MESSTIALLIRYFNISLTATLALFAVFGVIALISRKWRLKIFGGSVLLALCVAALAAFALEATVFNFPYYLKYFADPEISTTEPSAKDPSLILTSEDGYLAEISAGGKKDSASATIEILFRDLNRKVTSIFTQVNFTVGETAEMFVMWTDEEGTRGFTKTVYRYMPRENYTPIQPCGTVSELRIILIGADAGTNIGIAQVALNRQIPPYYSGLRILVVSLLIFAVLAVCVRKLRAGISYLLFEYKFDPADKKQNMVYALSVVLLILFSLTCVYTSVKNESAAYTTQQQYNKFLVDALLNGRTHLDYGEPSKMLNTERPYDTDWLIKNGYARDVDWMWDWAWYKGKFYCYFGVVPAVILYVPYKIITGNYLSNHAGVFLFVSISIVLLAALWRFCVKRYMPDMRFVFYLLSFLTLFFAIGIYAILRNPYVYTIVQSAGFMFVVAGILLLLKSVKDENVNRLNLFFACLCFALIAGCRPNMIFVSVLVPVVLWRYRSWKLLLFVMIPYMIGAVPLCVYNYVRFDSVFEFGAKYNQTAFGMTAYGLLNPIGKVIRMFESAAYYLFYPNRYSLHFPFVETIPPVPGSVTMGVFRYYERGSAMINFPIVFCLFYLFKNIFAKDKPKTFGLLSAFLGIAAIIIFINSLVIGFGGRYTMDFAIWIILPSLFCAYYCATVHQNPHYPILSYPNPPSLRKLYVKAVYVLLTVSVLTGLFLFVKGTPFIHIDPVLYRYLEYSLGIIRNT